jgi:hypothetical protein
MTSATLGAVLITTLLCHGCVAPGELRPRHPSTRSASPATARGGESQHESEAEPERGAGTQALNFFTGGSGEVGDLDGVTFGLDYEYRVTPRIGAGGFAEVVTGLERSFATGLQFSWHAVAELVLVAGPGFERRHGDQWRPIGRFGAFYEIPLSEDGWVLSPAVFYDVTESEDLWLYGANIGYVW